MIFASNLIIIFIAVLHLYFLILEMFLWTKPLGLKAFGQSLDRAKQTKVLAANQGLYNGFLSAGLIWSLLASSSQLAWELKVFFLGCVFVAGVFGGFTANKKIFFIQALPAMIGMAILFFIQS